MTIVFAVLAVCAAGVAGAFAQDSSHHSHDAHGDYYERAAVYDVDEAGTSTLIIVPGEAQASFEEESLAFMLVPATEASADGLEGAEENAESGKS